MCVVVKGLCQGLVFSDYVSLVVDGVYLKRLCRTSDGLGVAMIHSSLVPSHGGDPSVGPGLWIRWAAEAGPPTVSTGLL